MTAPAAPSPALLRLGTRRSPLAMAQAEEARAALCAAHPGLMVEIVPVTASGDRVLDRPLADLGGKALWTRELDAWLLGGKIDLAVHSAKDVETLRPPAIAIAAVLRREDVRDVLVGAASLAALPLGARIGTSAPRRAALALHHRPDCVVVPLRGNVATRLARLAAGEVDATLLARAGLNRLGQGTVGATLAAETWLPAPGQGAILIECRSADSATLRLLGAVNHPPSKAALLAERGLLAALGGNCHSAVGMLTRTDGAMLHLSAALFSPDGAARVDGEVRVAPGDVAALGHFAADLLGRAPVSIAAHFGGGR